MDLHRLPVFSLLAGLVWLGVACTPAQVAPSEAASVWGPVRTAATAEQIHPPALLTTPGRLLVGWVGADETGVHHDARVITDVRASQVVVLPLPPTFPRRLQLAEAGGEGAHWFWLDADNTLTVQLHSAVIDTSLEVFRGPLVVSDNRTDVTCYDVLPGRDHSAWALWRGGDAARPVLYSAFIEPTGLNLRVQPIADNAGCPVAVQGLDQNYIVWSRAGELVLAEFVNGRLLTPHIVGAAPTLATGDRLHPLRAGMDDTHITVFWNITRADGTTETWHSSGEPGAASWPEPSRLRLAWDETTSFNTTLNTGTTYAARTLPTGSPAAWAAPLEGVTTLLPVAVQVDNALGVLYLDAGEVVGYQRVVATGRLLAPPTLHLDQDRHLYLAWSDPAPTGPARLRLTTTRPLPPG